MTPEHHVPRPNRRLSQTAGTAKRNSSPDNLPRPANIPQPKLPRPIFTSKPRRHASLQRYTCTSPAQLRALRWSVTKQSSWQKPLLPTSNTQRNSSTSYLLVRCFVFFCSVAGEVLRPEELPCTSTNGHLQQQPSWQTFPFSVLP